MLRAVIYPVEQFNDESERPFAVWCELLTNEINVVCREREVEGENEAELKEQNELQKKKE